MRRFRRVYNKKQIGQAMTEFVVVASLVLIPLFLLVPILGKQIDMNHKTIQSARYEAWEYTAWNKGGSNTARDNDNGNFPNSSLPSRFLGYKEAIPEKSFEQVKTEANYRFFTKPSSEIKRKDMEKVSFTVNPLWKDHKDDDLLVLDIGNKVDEELTPDLTSGLTGGVPLVTGFMNVASTVLDVLTKIISTVTDGGFSAIEMKGKFVGKSQTKIPELAWAKGSYDNDIITNRQAAVMSLAWSAGGKNHAGYQIKGLVPTALLDISGNSPLMADVMQAIATIFLSPEIGPKWLEFGYVGDDTVPATRLFKGDKQGSVQCGKLSSYNYARKGEPDSDKLGIFTPDTAREVRTDTTLTRDAKKFNSCSSTLP